jgi:transposase
MKKTKRKFTSDFKLKVILDALTERETLTVLSQKYNLHPNQISLWKQDFLEKSKQILESKKENSAKEKQNVDALFAKIGQLQMELDFLKKKLS